MKLYIPTSSRNFNCIFSEESISPRAFYKVRGFGYSNWHGIPENPYENCTVLYEELKAFTRPSEGYDDYPLVIEIDAPNKMMGAMMRDGKTRSYVYDGVLYFSPQSTRFIFFDAQHRDIALSKASGSLETKLVNVYTNQIVVEKVSGNYVAPVIEQPILNENELALSQRINKVKGFAFGYYIGSLLSVSKEQAARIQKYQSILNVAAAIASSIDKRPTQRQIEQLQALCLNSPVPKALAKEFNLDENTASAILNYLTQHGWTPDEQTRSSSNLYNCIINPEKQEEAINWLSGKLDAALGRVSGEWKKAPVLKDIEILPDATVDFNRYRDSGKEEPYKLLSYWVNKVFADSKYEGSLSSYRGQLADDLTLSAKDQIYGDDWQESKTRAYMNSVRRNIAGEEFTEKWSDGVLCSVAAVLMKGDTWEGLRKFMLSESLYDYTLAFAFYGILTGFANLPRDFMDVLLDFADRKYTNAVYCSITDMIAAVRINTVIDDDDLPEDDLPEDDLPEDNVQPTSFFERIHAIGEEIMDKIIPDRQEEEPMDLNIEEEKEDVYDAVAADDPKERKQEEIAPQEKHPTLHPVFKDLVTLVEAGFANGKGRDAKVKYYTTALHEICSSCNTCDEICAAIAGVGPFKKNDGWGKVQKELSKELKSKARLEKIQAEKEKSSLNPVLFSENSFTDGEDSEQGKSASAESFLYDPDAWSVIKAQLDAWKCDDWSEGLIESHFDLFRNEYQPSYYHPFKKETVPGKNVNLPKDNESVLEQYRKNLEYRKKLKPVEYKKVKIDSLIWTLKNHYRR